MFVVCGVTKKFSLRDDPNNVLFLGPISCFKDTGNLGKKIIGIWDIWEKN